MLFSGLCESFGRIEGTRSGNEMRTILSALLKKTSPDEAGIVCNLIEGQLASPYEGIVVGFAEKMAVRAIANAYGKDASLVGAVTKKMGDAGSAAESLARARKATLGLKAVFSELHRLAGTSGGGSQESKIAILSKMLRSFTPIEAKYLVRFVCGQLRLGAGTMTLLDALAMAFLGGKEKRSELEAAYNICPDIGLIAETCARRGLAGIRKIGIKPGRPIKMMLASRTDSIASIKEKMGLICAEEKYDGERVQAHFDGKRLTLFSRRLDAITEQFPDVIEGLRRGVRAKRYVIEGECCAVDARGNLEPFQKLMKRRRKHDVEAYSKSIPVTLFLFDILYLNGKTYLDKPYLERRKALASILKISGGEKGRIITLARNTVTDDIDKVEEFFNESLERGCEGIIAKNAGAEGVYQAGSRGTLWIKWKREYSKEMRDTFDLAVVGAYMGRGKRAGHYGALLCAAYNDKTDRYETICKLGSGFSDLELGRLEKRLGKYRVGKKPNNVAAKMAEEPDVWFKPGQVCEVLGAELTRSPTHTCAEAGGNGLAIRFPRLVRWRDDKDAEQATTSREIEKMAKRR